MSDEPPWSSSRAPLLAVLAAGAVLVIVPLWSRCGATAEAAANESTANGTAGDDARGGEPLPGPTLSVMVSDSGGARALEAGDIVHPGDTLGFSVRTADRAQLTVVGVDGQGRARVHAGPWHAEAGAPLTGEVVLDAVLGVQRYVAFACILPVAVDALLAAARAQRPGVDGCSFDVVTAKKIMR